LALLLRQPDVIATPKASLAHVRDNRAAADLTLGEDDLAALIDGAPERTLRRFGVGLPA